MSACAPGGREAHDADALAASIVQLATDGGLRRRLAENGSAAVRRTMAWGPVIEAWEHALAGAARITEQLDAVLGHP